MSRIPRRRGVPRQSDDLPVVVIFTEGRRTEVDYINHWYRIHRTRVRVIVDDFHGVPASLVDRAAARKRREAAAGRRQRGAAVRTVNEYWCVFDVDEHPNVPAAINKADGNEIEVAVSNPCIELWFLLHFEAQTAPISRHETQRLAKQHLGSSKSLAPQALRLLEEQHPEARKRAIELDKKHRGDASPPRSNPSSNLWQLIDRIAGTAASNPAG